MAQKTKESSKIEAPNATFTYKKGEDELSIFMSYGLLNRLTKVGENLERVMTISSDPELQDKCLALLLSPRKDGKPDPENFDIDRDTEGLDLETIQNLIIWAGEHVTSFFIGLGEKNMENAMKTQHVIEGMQEKANNLTASLIGSQNSTS